MPGSCPRVEADDTPFCVIATAVAIVFVMLGAAAVAFSFYGLLVPPFTDAELRENFVDTWEAHVLGGVVILALYGVGLLMAVTGVALGKSSRFLFSIASGAFILACLFEAISLELLTRRTEALLGHELRWLI
jgi:hypothetical protein